MKNNVAASINAAFRCWYVNSGTYEQDPDRPSWGVFWEPLDVACGPAARPHCCYTNQIAFYDKTGNRLIVDLVNHFEFMGGHPHLLFIHGAWREVVNGRCEYHNDQWHMRWTVSTNTKYANVLNTCNTSTTISS